MSVLESYYNILTFKVRGKCESIRMKKALNLKINSILPSLPKTQNK